MVAWIALPCVTFSSNSASTVLVETFLALLFGWTVKSFGAWRYRFFPHFQIAVVNVQLSGLQFIQEAHGYDSFIKLQAKHLNVSDCTSIPYDEFQVN